MDSSLDFNRRSVEKAVILSDNYYQVYARESVRMDRSFQRLRRT